MVYNYTKLPEDKIEYVQVAAESELPNGERIFVDIDDFSIVIFNIAGEFFAIGDICSHDDGPLGDGTLDGHEAICPRHGARFDVRDGEAMSLPAIVDIPAYPTRVVEGQIEVGLPLEN